MTERAQVFAALRPDLVALAYRMLGDVARAEDLAQEAWLRWHAYQGVVESPRAFLVTVVTRLCLNELGSARARREESRGDRLPEPVAVDEGGLGRVEALEQLSMAALVVLQRLAPAERAVLLLHDVFEMSHQEIAALVGRSAAGSRKLLERARRRVSVGRRLAAATRDEHQRLLQAFVAAASTGDVAGLVALLAPNAVMITDGGATGRRLRGQRNLTRPLRGAARIAAFVAATSRDAGFAVEERALNRQPAVILRQDGQPLAALLLAVADGKIERVFFCADPSRLGHLG